MLPSTVTVVGLQGQERFRLPCLQKLVLRHGVVNSIKTLKKLKAMLDSSPAQVVLSIEYPFSAICQGCRGRRSMG